MPPQPPNNYVYIARNHTNKYTKSTMFHETLRGSFLFLMFKQAYCHIVNP